MTTVALDRRFYEWSEDADGLAHARYREAAGLSDGMLGWNDLLAKRRVVILAEAGSGKTAELAEQARLQTATGKFAFYATVQDVGRDGLESALRPADRERLNAWRSTGASPSVKTSLYFSLMNLGGLIGQAALKGVNEEQTASLQTALLHGRIGLSCGPRCEPLSGAPFRSRGHRRFEPPRVSRACPLPV